MGLEDGMRGEIDTNEKFSDGYRENIAAKKSAAGQFLSDYAGIRGGANVGSKIGLWGGGLACGAVAASFLSGFVAAGVAAGALAGVFPVVAATALVLGAAVVGGSLLGVAGKYVGGVAGAVVGGIGGAAVGLYNGVFRRGYYEKPKAPDKVNDAPLTDAPQPVPEPRAPGQNLAEPQPLLNQTPQPQGAVIAQNHPRVEAVLNNTAPPASKKDAVLAANNRIPQQGFISRMGNLAAIAGGSALAAIGVKSAVTAVQNRRAQQQDSQSASAPRYYAPAEAPQSAPARGDMSRAMGQVDADMAKGVVRRDIAASPEDVAAAQAAQPQGFADRLRHQAARSPSQDGIAPR